MKVEEIEKDVSNLQSYINPFKAREYLNFLFSCIRTLEEGIESFIDWSTGPESTIPNIPDNIWIPFRKLLEEE